MSLFWRLLTALNENLSGFGLAPTTKVTFSVVTDIFIDIAYLERRTTAIANIPSSLPANPSFSVVVALIVMLSDSVSITEDMAVFISGIKEDIFGSSRQTVLSMLIIV